VYGASALLLRAPAGLEEDGPRSFSAVPESAKLDAGLGRRSFFMSGSLQKSTRGGHSGTSNQVELLITDNELCVVQRTTEQSKTGFFRDYGSAEAPPGFQAGWSECMFFFFSLSVHSGTRLGQYLELIVNCCITNDTRDYKT
jgi:hypothetical protein